MTIGVAINAVRHFYRLGESAFHTLSDFARDRRLTSNVSFVVVREGFLGGV